MGTFRPGNPLRTTALHVERSYLEVLEKTAETKQITNDRVNVMEATNSMEATNGMETTNGMEPVEITTEEEELSETQKLLQKVKQAGTAGAISYALWELGFWGISIPMAGHWPDFSNQEDLQKIG